MMHPDCDFLIIQALNYISKTFRKNKNIKIINITSDGLAIISRYI